MNPADQSILEELHDLLDNVDVDGSIHDLDQISRSDLSTLGQTLYDVLNRSQKLTNIYKHYFSSSELNDRFCKHCSLYMTDYIHHRIKND